MIEGSRIAVRWDGTADDPWLTLGQLPLVRDPQVLRRQRLKALGEPLELRFGLMNESVAERIPLAASVYSSGLLADVSATTDLYFLKLRHAIEAAPDLRVWVWEDESSEPRILSRSEVEVHSDNCTLSVLQMSVGAPLGWLVSLEGEWHGARFHFNPGIPEWSDLCYRWTSTLACSCDWPTTASALRWWRFPVLMEPFKDVVQEQVKRYPLETLLAWGGPATRPEWEISRSDADFFSNPIRTFLWQYSPTAEAYETIWSVHGEAVLKSMETAKSRFHIACACSHPVLLAKVICEILSIYLAAEEAAIPIITNGNLFRRVQVPEKISAIESKYRSLFRITRDFVERSAGVFSPDRKMLDALFRPPSQSLEAGRIAVRWTRHIFARTLLSLRKRCMTASPAMPRVSRLRSRDLAPPVYLCFSLAGYKGPAGQLMKADLLQSQLQLDALAAQRDLRERVVALATSYRPLRDHRLMGLCREAWASDENSGGVVGQFWVECIFPQ